MDAVKIINALTCKSFLCTQVSSNGFLSFDIPFTAPLPRHFPIIDRALITPFWNVINIQEAGQTFYRYSDDKAILSQVGATISSAFAHFAPALLFIATWDNVAEMVSH